MERVAGYESHATNCQEMDTFTPENAQVHPTDDQAVDHPGM